MTEEFWPRSEDDCIELGDTHWVPTSDGGLENRVTKESMDAEGNLYNKTGELIKEAHSDEETG